jgi:hypothetical protein
MANEFIARNGVIAQNDSQVTGSLIVTNGITGSLFGTSSWAVNAITANTASYILNATSASFAATGSYADNFTVKNTLTAQTLVVSVVSSSVVYSSGSNIFGNSLTDTQKFTGSVQITGSLSVNGTTATLGTGTINTVPKFTAVNTIGNSNITDNGTLITLNTGSYVNGNLSIGTATIPFGEKLFIQGDASAASAVLTTSANSGISTLSVNVDRGLQGGVNIIADKTNQLGIIRVNNSDFWPLVFQVRGADGTIERMRITNIGSVGIGATSLTGYNLRVSKNITGAISSSGIQSDGVIQSDVTTSTSYNATLASTAATTFTIGTITHYIANQGTFGAGSTVTNQWGFHASSNLIGATNNYGFRGAIPSGTNRWNLYMDGTANNYMAGSLGIGTTFALGGTNLAVGKNITGGYLFTSTAGAGIVSNGQIQSDVTLIAFGYATQLSTQATAFTLGGLQHYTARNVSIGSTSAITVQTGFNVENLTGAAVNYGFRGFVAAATNAWNLHMDGTANNYMAGSLGIGATSLTEYSLRIAKNITGAVTSYGIRQEGTVQSGVTTSAFGIINTLNTAAAAFTIPDYFHFTATQGTIGSTSAITNQIGFAVGSSMTGATNNYGFYGAIASGTNRWNLYMAGTAANYMAGDLGIGTTTIAARLTVVGATTVIGQTNVSARFSDNLESTLLISHPASTGNTATITGNNQLAFATGTVGNIAERIRISSTGSVGIGSTSLTGYNLRVSKTITGATTSYGIMNDGVIQSGVTSNSIYNATTASTVAASFTLGAIIHNYANQGTFGAGSSVTNQFGFLAENTMIGATNNYGFFGNIASGTNRWNLYMNGTAANYMAGTLNIGSTGLGGTNFSLNRAITGGWLASATFGVNMYSAGAVQSDVTGFAYYFVSRPSTAATAFTVGTINSFAASVVSVGAGSTIGTLHGFNVEATHIGATNNFAFRGQLAAAANTWNLYMNGTANNYLAGNLVIGTTTVPSSKLGIAHTNDFGINITNLGTGGLNWQIGSTNDSYFSGGGKLIFTYGDLSANSILTLVQATKNVGINKTNPSASLDVSGSALITGSLGVTAGITGSLFGTASYADQAATASYFVTSSVTSASYAETSSYADNFTVANQLTATTLVVQTISSSVVYSSGSNVFGNSLSNTQQFTGSVTITGSLGVNTTNVTRTLTVNGSIFAGGVTTYNKSYNSLDTTGVAVAGLSAGANGDSALFTFTCYGGLGYQRIVYSCRNESTTWRTSKTIDEGANALDVLASVDGATITFTFRGRSALQQFRPSVIIEASGNSIDTTYL